MKKRPGLTLLELIVSMTIMVMIVMVVINIFIGINRFNTDEQNRVLAGDEATRTFSTLDQTLRQAKAVSPPVTINSITYTSGDSTVVLSLPSIVGGTPSETLTDTAVITWDSAAQQLVLVIAADPASSRASRSTILTTGVSDVYLRYTSDDPVASTTVTATIVVTATANNKPFNQTAVLYVPLRNHP